MGGCDAFFSLQHGIFSRGCDAPECCETICNLLRQRKLLEHAFLGQHRSTYCRGVQRCEMGCRLCGRAGGGYFSGWEDTFGVVLGAAWKEMAQQQQQKGWKLGLGASFGLRRE